MSNITAASSSPDEDPIQKLLRQLVANIPLSSEPESDNPHARARQIAKIAALKAATFSGALALPPGPLGMATILPDIYGIWRLQQQMVADIAATFGKNAALTPEVMLYCLFRHGAAMLFRDIVVRVSERVFVRRIARRYVQQMLQKIGVKVTQRLVAKTASRWVPIIGAAGVAAYAYYDTKTVADTALDTFSHEIEIEIEPPDDAPNE